MADPMEHINKLEGQVDEMLALYDLAEKAYPYSKVHGEESRELNEDAHRRNMVAFQHYGIGSTAIL